MQHVATLDKVIHGWLLQHLVGWHKNVIQQLYESLFFQEHNAKASSSSLHGELELVSVMQVKVKLLRGAEHSAGSRAPKSIADCFSFVPFGFQVKEKLKLCKSQNTRVTAPSGVKMCDSKG